MNGTEGTGLRYALTQKSIADPTHPMFHPAIAPGAVAMRCGPLDLAESRRDTLYLPGEVPVCS